MATNTTHRAKKLLAALALAALVALTLPLPALADDELPPVPTEPAVTDESAVEATTEQVSESVPDATEVPDDVLTSTAEAPVEESTVPETAETPTIAEDPGLIPDLPENTELIVVDENGAPVALASVEAADTLATGDPIWCPATVTMPVNGGSGCSPSQTSFAALITWLENNPKSVAGTIWIEKTFDSGSADLLSTVFTLDGGPTGNLPTLANFALTIKGGWNGIGFNTINTSDPSEFNGALEILNWNADITLSDILFTGIPTGDALYIDTLKKITLTRVDVIDNAGNGAVLDNTDGGTGTGAVVITTSTFSGNGGDGLTIDSRGTITLSYISAYDNGGYGAVLSNDTAPSDLAVTFTGINEFKFNGGGLLINSRGAVTLKNVYANYNNLYEGATIDNSASTTGAAVTLTGTNQFNQNGSHGLEIISKGGIAINKLSANGNGLAVGAITSFGAHLDNSTANLPKLVSLTTSNSFSDNTDYGLFVQSKGAVTIALLTADRNGGNGAEINNTAGLTTSPQNVTFTGAGSFTENNGVGLTISTYGAVLLGGVTANDNNLAGAVIKNNTGSTSLPRAVTLNGSNNFINNGDYGLQIASRGAITVNSVFADENFTFGAWLNNSTATTAAAVMVKGTSEFNSNGGYGLNIQSKGNITVYNFDADWNGGYGLQFVNNVAGSVGNVTVITTLTSWCNSAIENNGRGMLITSYGNVSLSHLCSEGNLGEGVRIENNNANSAKSVILSGNNGSSDNDETGLVILSKGPVTINNLYLSGNGWIDDTGAMDGLGAYINNRLGGTSSFQNVTFTGRVSAFDNFYSGMEVYSYGAISLTNATADNNGFGEELEDDRHGVGFLLDNQTLLMTTYPKAISLKGDNSFTGNWDGGLKILGSGAITISNIEASYNNGFGAILTNDFSGADFTSARGGLTIVGYGEFNENGEEGISVYMFGPINSINLSADDNLSTAGGATLMSLFGNVTLTGYNSFHRNVGWGLHVNSAGNITISNLYANSNHGIGAWLMNDNGTGAITLTGVLRFGYNWNDGLNALSNKAMAFSNIDAHGNGGNGVTLYSLASISLLGNNTSFSNIFDGNWQAGVNIEAPASVTLTNIHAINNGWEGVYIDNTSGPTTGTLKGVTISGTNIFNNNGWDGLSIQSNGTIKANSITANGNEGSGAYLDNLDPSYDFTSGVALTGTNTFNYNTGPYQGLEIHSHGNITVNNITANQNSGGGAYILNWSYNDYYGKAPVNVIFTGTNIFNNNTFDDTIPNTDGAGLYIYTEGSITLNNITANENEQEGVYINNYDWSWTNPSITINGINEFSDNGLNGIYIISDGNVSLTRATAELNTQTGVSIDTTGKVTLTCASLNFNEDLGWQIRGLNGITLIAVLTYGNTDGDGLNLGGSLTTIRSCTLS